MSSINDIKKSRGRPKVDSHGIMVRLAQPIIEALDQYRLDQSPPINRAAALRQFATEALKRRGLLKK